MIVNSVRRSRTIVIAMALSAAALSGCSAGATSDWDAVDERRQAEVAAVEWLGADGDWDLRAPASQWSRSEPAAGVWERPSVERVGDVPGPAWRLAADEVRAAVDTGWRPAFVRCGPDAAMVDLVSTLDDGSSVTARVEAQTGTDVGWTVRVTAVALHHSDADPGPVRPGSGDVDLGCLDGAAAAITWSGTPALLNPMGGPALTDG